MNIAIEGCLHGELEAVYLKLEQLSAKMKINIDALIICGDFQAIRDNVDLKYMHCPPKYKTMGSFHRYYKGNKPAPFLTIFIGGNHEAVNSMRESYFGGWVAPNIYYLGQAGSIYLVKNQLKIRISGLSGIYNHRDFQHLLRTQNVPFTGEKERISAYHIKQLDVFRMELLGRISIIKSDYYKDKIQDQPDFDMFLSHDWPQNIALYGNMQELLKYKPFLKQQINDGTFGSPPLMRLLKILKPSYWFCAHMHIKYPALFPHDNDLYTHFLSLDKCLANRSCLSFLKFTKNQEISSKIGQNKVTIQYDPDWLAVLKITAYLQTIGDKYYLYDKNDLKCINGKLMNHCLEQYQEKYMKNHQISHKQILYEKEQSQLKQTLELLKNLQIKQQIFEGIIFEKKQQRKDEIELDL